MAKLEILADDAKQQISDLKMYRSGWANDIREGWSLGNQETQKILFELYEVSGSVILALEQVISGRHCDKMAMILVFNKLKDLVQSEVFTRYAKLNDLGFVHCVSTGTKHHIRVMFDCLKILTA